MDRISTFGLEEAGRGAVADREHQLTAVALMGDHESNDRLRSALSPDGEFLADVLWADRFDLGLTYLENLHADLVVVDQSVLTHEGSYALPALCESAAGAPVVVIVDPGEHEAGLRAMRKGADSYVFRNVDSQEKLIRTFKEAAVRSASKARLSERESRLALAFRGADGGLWDWDLTCDRFLCSKRWCVIVGLGEQELVEDPNFWFERVHSEDRSRLTRTLQAHFAGETPGFRCEFRMRHDSAGYRWFVAQGMCRWDREGNPVRMAGALTDIDASKRAEEQILFDAMHDGLTKLPNRVVFLDRVALALARLRRHPETGFAVLFIDLDRFKQVNDNFGHAAGDRLLVEVARRLELAIRPQDTVSRLCGDEFAVLVADANEAKVATQVAVRILKALRKPVILDSQPVAIAASVGIAMSSTGYEKAEEMIHDADTAMYRSKACGGSRCEIFDPEINRSTRALLDMESELRQAVANGDFVMHYQPIVCLDTHDIVGLEAMVRWRHPERGIITPAQFLAIAEASSLIVPIGWWAIEQSCQQIKYFQEVFPRRPRLWLGINIASEILVDEAMVDRLLGILYSSRLDPSSLRLEIREDVVDRFGEQAITTMQELRALGIGLSIDDFGEGFSSLKFFDRVDFDCIKIDPSQVDLVDRESRTPRVVESILKMADGLGMRVVAEGVERVTQHDSLCRLRCPEGQGFWFSKPVDPEAISRLLEAGPLNPG